MGKKETQQCTPPAFGGLDLRHIRPEPGPDEDESDEQGDPPINPTIRDLLVHNVGMFPD